MYGLCMHGESKYVCMVYVCTEKSKYLWISVVYVRMEKVSMYVWFIFVQRKVSMYVYVCFIYVWRKVSVCVRRYAIMHVYTGVSNFCIYFFSFL